MVEITFSLTSGSFSGVQFDSASNDYESFIKVNNDSSLTLYLTAPSSITTDNTLVLGTLATEGDVSYGVSYIKLVNFLLQEISYSSVSVEMVMNEFPSPDSELEPPRARIKPRTRPSPEPEPESELEDEPSSQPEENPIPDPETPKVEEASKDDVPTDDEDLKA